MSEFSKPALPGSGGNRGEHYALYLGAVGYDTQISHLQIGDLWEQECFWMVVP